MTPAVRAYFRSIVDSRFAITCVAAILIGVAAGIAFAQDRPPGRLDEQCTSQCVAGGYDPTYCGNVCWIPAPTKARPDEAINWICVTDCRKRGGQLPDCREQCKVQ